MHRAVVLSSFVLLSSVVASAEEPARATVAANLQQQLVAPMAQKDAERSRFSRARRPAADYRARVLDTPPARDARGRTFFAFALDQRREGKDWTDMYVGCVYPDDGSAFVRRGDVYSEAAALLGKKTEQAPAGVCSAATVTASR